MGFVGGGRGEYVQDVTYRYVGAGGDYTVTENKKTSFIACGGISLMAIAVIILLMFFLNPGESTTTSKEENIGPLPPIPPIPGRKETCTIWGDPHINTFDNGHADFYSEGEVWIVKSESIEIQARYAATPFTDGLAATETLAVGGAFLGGNVLKVGAMNGHITWNDQPILTTMPSSFQLDGYGSVSYNSQGDFVDDAMSQYEKHVVHIDLPDEVHIQVMRWSHHINVKITMPMAPGGQDGHCGNFNGDASDDTSAAIIARLGRGVTPQDSLFNNYVPYRDTKKVSLADCSPASKRMAAERTCREDRPGISGPELDDCTIDVCFGGERYAIQDSAY